MRAVVCAQEGPPLSLTVEEVDDPVLNPSGVTVRVEAAGLNYVDGLFVKGEYQIKPPTPFIPGGEVAGVVSGVGDEVAATPHAPTVGDRVIANVGLGAFAEVIAARPEQLALLPDALSFNAGAAFTQSYSTALFSLSRRAHLVADEWVLVLGAAGGVGRASIDVAKALGARVIAAASDDERLEQCRAAGADATINYSSADLKSKAREITGGGVDIVVDPIGGDLADPALRSLGYNGRYLVIGFARGEIPRLPLNQVLLRNRQIVGVDWGAWMLAHGDDQRSLLDEALAMVAAGHLHPPEPSVYPLDQAGRALDDLLNRRVVGKAVVVP